MGMKKILIVNDHFPPDHWGGSSSIAFLQAVGLRAKGFEVRVFATTQKKEVAGSRVYEGIPVRLFYTEYHPRWWAWRSLYNPSVVGEFERALKEFAPDIVHFHNIHHYFSYHTLAVAKRTGAKVFLTMHDVMSFAYQKLHHFIDYTSKSIPASFAYHVPWWVNARDARKRYNPFRNIVIRHYLRKAHRIFAVSVALKQALEDNGISGNVEVVHNGIDAAVFEQPFDQDALRAELRLGSGPVMLFVGRFTPDKGRDVLLKAFAKVIKEVPDAQLLVVGFNPDRRYESVMWHGIEELDIEKSIVFVPAVEYIHMHRYYALADVVVVPSVIFDSFPTANLEAFAAGRPVVTTCFGGSREAVLDGETGYVVNPLDIDLLTQRIAALLKNTELARRMGLAGRERLIKEFSLERQLANYERFYLKP